MSVVFIVFYFSEREKRERQRRQETNRTAVRSVPITQAGDRGDSPDLVRLLHRWQILSRANHGRRYVEYGGGLVQRGIFGNQPAGKVKRKPGSSTVSFETLIILYIILS